MNGKSFFFPFSITFFWLYRLCQIVLRDLKTERSRVQVLWTTASKGKVFEFGCGTGEMAMAFPPSDYIGFDINPEKIYLAQKKNPAHKFIKEIRWAELSSDILFLHNVCHHLEDGQLENLFNTIKGNRQIKWIMIVDLLPEGQKISRLHEVCFYLESKIHFARRISPARIVAISGGEFTIFHQENFSSFYGLVLLSSSGAG